MARIRWVEEDEAEGELAVIYEERRSINAQGIVPHIVKTMSLRPDFLKAIMDASALHFTDGALSRVQHEMIASYVSAVNRCHY